VSTDGQAPAADIEDVAPIRTERLELVSMSVPFMRALVARDLAAAGREVGASVPAWLPEHLDDFLGFRLAQLAVDPAIRHWLGRAMVLTDDAGRRRVVGTVGFHGPPDAAGRLEVGYSVDPEFRRRGFAREAVRAMLDWAASEHGIHRFIASVSPTNDPSLALVAGFGFRQTGTQVDEIDGLELVFEADWPGPLPAGPVGAGRR
jgi:RimJ/RimL family protein N-acetyltransferase